jgi:Response regulator containing a CheY-like receiver domain and an HTH DNA-binding domain
MINVLLVEDSRITRELIENRIASSDNYVVTASIENAANAEIACMNGNIDLILMDICTAEDESGLTAAASIKKRYPSIKIVMMTSMPEHSFLQKAAEAGCDGFWYKEYGDMDLIDVCTRVMHDEKIWPHQIPDPSIGLINSSDLTEREFAVLRELVLGHKYEEIAKNLDISENTVKYHIKNLLQKTGYRSTLQLVVDVVDKKLVLPKF